MLTINGIEAELLPHQARFLGLIDAGYRNPALVGGFGSGKSHAGLKAELRSSFLDPGVISIYASLTYPILQDAIIPEFRRILGHYHLREGTDYTLDSRNIFTNWLARDPKTGEPSRTYFRPVEGAGNLTRIIAVTAGRATLDEAARMSAKAKQAVTERVRDPRAKFNYIACVTTPEGMNWMSDCYVKDVRTRAAKAGAEIWAPDEQFRYVRAKTRDNPNLDEGYVNSLFAQYDSALVDAYLNGLFVPMFEGRCFPLFKENQHVTAQAEYNEHLPISLCWDFNVEPMNVTAGHYKNDELWTFDEFVLNGTTWDVCDAFLDKYGKHGAGVRIYGDRGGKSRTTQTHWTDYEIIASKLQHMHGFQECVPRSNPSQKDSVNEVNACLNNGHGTTSYWVHPRCGETIKSFLATLWNPKATGKILKKGQGTTEDTFEGPTDGIRYWVDVVKPIHRALKHKTRTTTKGARFASA